MVCVWNASPARGIRQGAYITRLNETHSTLAYYRHNRLVSMFNFPTFTNTFDSPLVRYENLIHTGHGEWDDDFDDEEKYALRKVIVGKRAVASSWAITMDDVRGYIDFFDLEDNEEFHYFIKPLPKIRGVREPRFILYVFRDAAVSEAFPNLPALVADYRSAGVTLETSTLKGSTQIGDIVRNGLEKEHLALIGLLYGYPIESTISLLTS